MTSSAASAVLWASGVAVGLGLISLVAHLVIRRTGGAGFVTLSTFHQACLWCVAASHLDGAPWPLGILWGVIPVLAGLALLATTMVVVIPLRRGGPDPAATLTPHRQAVLHRLRLTPAERAWKLVALGAVLVAVVLPQWPAFYLAAASALPSPMRSRRIARERNA